jgi:hypothetical protein
MFLVVHQNLHVSPIVMSSCSTFEFLCCVVCALVCFIFHGQGALLSLSFFIIIIVYFSIAYICLTTISIIIFPKTLFLWLSLSLSLSFGNMNFQSIFMSCLMSFFLCVFFAQYPSLRLFPGSLVCYHLNCYCNV